MQHQARPGEGSFGSVLCSSSGDHVGHTLVRTVLRSRKEVHAAVPIGHGSRAAPSGMEILRCFQP